MKLQHFLFLCGALSFTTFVIAKNNLLINDQISFILSSDYIFYISVFFIFMGFHLSTKEKAMKQ